MTRLFEILTIIGTVIGALVFFVTIVSANSIPQQAGGTTMALAFAVIPYCLSSTSQRRALIKQQKEIYNLATSPDEKDIEDA